MRASRIALVVVGALAAVVGLGLTLAGGALVWAHTTSRDADGYLTAPTARLRTPTAAVVSEHLDLGADRARGDWVPPGGTWASVRIAVDGRGGGPVFVGVGPADEVDAYLRGVAHEVVRELGPGGEASLDRVAGTATAADPGGQAFWVASTVGTAEQELVWDARSGDWAVVVMDADARTGLDADVSVGVRVPALVPVAAALLVVGIAALVGGTALALAGTTTGRRPTGRAPEPVAPVAAGAYPTRLDGHLDTDLSRWRWLVKWVLAIPHLLVLSLLWLAFGVLTVLAGIAIAVTGRYPRSIWDFNVGVLRWTWRVTFYAFTLGTDRYPPFTMDEVDDYPARFDVAYPERLSRRLVWVKWWLLALPHHVVLALFGGGVTWWSWGGGADDGRGVLGGGLLGLLVVLAGVLLAVTGRYPRAVFDVVMGAQRWIYRVIAYAALMRDEYPPFRFDAGGDDPAATPEPPPAPAPSDPEGALAGT